MATEVTLPQLGESVTEGIITAWLVEVGDTIEADQPLFEVSTDKVDTEVPSPVSGVVTELRAEIDEEVEVGQVIAVIDETGEGAGPASAPAAEEAPAAAPAPEPAPEPAPAPAATQTAPTPAPAPAQPAAGGNGSAGVAAPGTLVSPLVRKLLRQAGVDPGSVRGTGQGGRITRDDAERAIAGGGGVPAPAAAGAPAAASGPAPAAAPAPTSARPEGSPVQVDFGGQREVTQDLTRMRKAIAKAMHESITTTAQLTAVVEADVTRLMNLRARAKDAFKAQHGASLSPMPIITRAVLMTLPRHPSLNASMDLDAGTATYRNYVNLGIAVDTENGLIVPNIKDAQNLTIAGLAQGIADVAKKARGKGLKPDDISGGTFTITNTGSRGAMIDTPILNPPEVAILATTLIEKRPVVVEGELGDQIAIRQMTYLCLTYDHRMVDGADAARFLVDLKWVLENHDFSAEVGA